MDGSTLDDLTRELESAIDRATQKIDFCGDGERFEDVSAQIDAASEAREELHQLEAIALALSTVVDWRNGLCDAARDARREPARRMAAGREQFAEGGI